MSHLRKIMLIVCKNKNILKSFFYFLLLEKSMWNFTCLLWILHKRISSEIDIEIVGVNICIFKRSIVKAFYFLVISESRTLFIE